MKTSIVKITIAAMSLITIGTMISPPGYLARKAAQHKAAAIGSCRTGAEIPGHNCSEVMNGLFTASGR